MQAVCCVLRACICTAAGAGVAALLGVVGVFGMGPGYMPGSLVFQCNS
jgi:hypothetical protein